MVFYGVTQTESLYLYEEHGEDKTYVINLTMASHEPKFYVHVLDTDDCIWEFNYTSKTDYERVKMSIMDVIEDCDSFTEALETLNEVFLEYFEDMLASDDDHVCQCGNGCCSNKLN